VGNDTHPPPQPQGRTQDYICMYIVSTNLIDCRIIEVAIGYRAITTIGVSSMVVGKVFVLFFFFENGFSF